MVDGRQFRLKQSVQNIRGLFHGQTGDELIRSLSPAAWFRADTGVTVTGQGASTWADQSGNGRDLLQGTDANRPIALLHTGTNYLYAPGVAANYAATPSATANKITGDIDIRVRVAITDWTIAASQYLISKYGGAGNRSYLFGVEGSSTGKLQFQWTADGTTLLTEKSSVASGLTDATAYWVRVTMDVNDGAGNRVTKFYTAADSETEPTSWTQLGSTVTTVGATSIFDSTAALEVLGFTQATAGSVPFGKLYRATIYNGYDGAGSKVVDFNPSLATDQAATFTASAGEVWTINTSGAKPAQIVARSSLLFDGSASYLKCDAFTLNQPETVYILFKQVSWTSGDYVYDGNAGASGILAQSGSSPDLVFNTAGGANTSLTGDATVGTYSVVWVKFNGASSAGGVNLGAEATGDSGTTNMGGFTLGAAGNTTHFSNIQVLEALIFPTAHDANQRARVIQYLAGRHGIAL